VVREVFREESPSAFFYKNRQLAGFSNPTRALYTAVRELVENSLDACDLHGIKPDIFISLTKFKEVSGNVHIYKLTVIDNGCGIPREYVLKALGRVFVSSKYVLRQSRGTFGLGGTMALLYAQATSNKPIRVVTSTGGRYINSFKFYIDIEKNEAKTIEYNKILNRDGWHGTLIELYLEGNYRSASRYILSYLKQTATILPYARIIFIDPNGVLYYFKRTIEYMPRPPKETKPHPHGIDLETLKRMLRDERNKGLTLIDFLVKRFHRVGYSTASKFLSYADIDPNIRIGELNDNDIERLYISMKNYNGFLPPSADVLSPIGLDVFKNGIIKEYNPEYIDLVVRPPSSYSGHPFIIEAALAYGGDIPGEPGEIKLFRYANKIPLIFDEGIDVATKVLKNINFSIYKRPSDKPIALFIHIVSTKIPFKTLGKEAIADIPEIEREIELAFRYLFRRLSKHVSRIERHKKASKKFKTYERYLELIGYFSAKMVGREKPDVSKLLERIKERYKLK